VLEEIELLVARGLGEILAVIFLALGLDVAVGADDLVALLLAEWRIGQDDVVVTDDHGPPPGGRSAADLPLSGGG